MTNTTHGYRYRLGAFLLSAVIAVGMTGLVSAPASAVESEPHLEIGTMTFYAFVKTGERMDVDVESAGSVKVLNQAGTAISRSSSGLTATAAANGVWQVVVTRNANTDNMSYNIRVLAGSTEKTGRIWTYTNWLEQTAVDTLNYYGVSDLGYIYQVTMHDIHGYTSKIALRSAGAAENSNCEVENRSFDRGSSYLSAYLDCGDLYRLFFEEPDPALPATANLAGTTVPVLPKVVTNAEVQAATSVSFTANPFSVGGYFGVKSHASFSGTIDVQLDTNSNGSYTDSVDMTRTVVVNKGRGSWSWDGNNGNGAPVVGGGKARAVVERSAEAHLLLHDIEYMSGVTMTRLNGDGAPNSTIYWDDRQLTAQRGSTTPVKSCLSGCNSSSSSSVHGWVRGDAQVINGVKENQSTSWGDASVVDNWAYVSMSATSSAIAIPAVYELSFNGVNGDVSDASKITRSAGNAWGTLPVATRAGYVFTGWFTTPYALYGGSPVTADTLATTSRMVYAQYRPAEFNVVFDSNVELGTVTGSTASMNATYDCDDCTLTPNGFTKTTGAKAFTYEDSTESTELNSKFLGWSLSVTSRIADIADGANAGRLSMTDGDTVTLYAVWDDAPQFVISEYPNRFFGLKQAQAGGITEEELLSTVVASDRETNPLERKTQAQVASSGDDVGITLYDYDSSDFTSMTAAGTVSVTYKVKDEAGHVAFLGIRATVSDSAPVVPAQSEYLRGISSNYVGLASSDGGLAVGSLWRLDPTRQEALVSALAKDTEGTTYCLDVDAITALRDQITADGLGNSKVPDGLSDTAAILRDRGANCE